jgi:hypothetical protein
MLIFAAAVRYTLSSLCTCPGSVCVWLCAGTNAVQLQRAMSGVGVDVIMPGRRAAHANGKSATPFAARCTACCATQAAPGCGMLQKA